MDDSREILTDLIKKQTKMIYEMAKMINFHDIDEDVCRQMCSKTNCNYYEVNENECIECVIRFFENKIDSKTDYKNV